VNRLQQPPLQADAPTPPQPVPHVWFPSQALSEGQSVALLHPHAPLTHAPPLAEPVQFTHAPGGPQLVGVFAHGPGPESGAESVAAS
jgi:hypothetical protein